MYPNNGRTNRHNTRGQAPAAGGRGPRAQAGRPQQGRPQQGSPQPGRPQYKPYGPYGERNPGHHRKQSMDKFKGVVQFTVAVIVAAIPISFYLVQPGDLQRAVASNHTSEDIKQILNTLGGNIKDKASDVFSDGRSMKVQVKESGASARPAQTLRQDNRAQVISKPAAIEPTVTNPVLTAPAVSDHTHSEEQPSVAQTELQQEIQPDVQPVSTASAPPQMSTAGTTSPTVAAKTETALQHAAKHTDPNYICPMHPDVISKDPNAICPICGMDLVLLEAGGEAGTVKLSPTVINTLGVRTAPAKRRTLFRKINSVGYVELDETKLRTVNLRVDGWIEKLYVSSEGDRVEKGKPLFEVYSPKLVNAQEEYVQALQHQNDLVTKASRERLLSLGVSEEQVELLQTQEDVKQHVVINAPQDGVISQHKIREGQFVKPSQTLLEIVDLSSIWVIAEIFESQSDWVKKGQRTKASLPFLPGKSFEGMVDYIYPALDPKTRSLKVRLRFDNPEETIKPNMYADVQIYAKPKKKVLTIPREALITTGDENRVIISMGEGKFIPMSVKVGMRTDKGVEILRGLSEGDVVVTSSQFLIDSESSLKASLAKMAGGG